MSDTHSGTDSGLDLAPWEPEETVGKLWHAWASRLDAPDHHEDAAVTLDEMRGRMGVLFRALGGGAEVEIRPAPVSSRTHRLSWRRKLGHAAERGAHASFDGEALRVPERLAHFPAREANGALCLWLAALAAHVEIPPASGDALRDDLLALAALRRATLAARETGQGIANLHDALAAQALERRRPRRLPRVEAALEEVIRHLLGAADPLTQLAERLLGMVETGDTSAAQAPVGYRTFLPVPLWPDIRPTATGRAAGAEEAGQDGAAALPDGRHFKASRQKDDEVQRRDSLILHKFEAILSWADFMNLNRKVEEDETENARKAADDLDEIGLGQVSERPASKLKLHLDLSPEEADRERLSGVHLYPEWDHRTRTWLPDHCRVLASRADPAAEFAQSPEAQRRIRAVRRHFEALRPRRVILPAQPDGDDLDLDAAVRSRADLIASGEGSDRVWRAARTQARDLAVSILLDISRSTEASVNGRAVIDIAREALTALAWGISACGDDAAIHAFSSLKRDRVYLLGCKDFGEKMGPGVEARIAGLRPGFYTRLGAALRHASAGLAEQQRSRRLLLVITDGKPNDLDHYEGRHGVEDTAAAIREARMRGHAVFGIAIDAKGQRWFPRMFGPGGFALVDRPEKLIDALPAIYRRVTGI